MRSDLFKKNPFLWVLNFSVLLFCDLFRWWMLFDDWFGYLLYFFILNYLISQYLIVLKSKRVVVDLGSLLHKDILGNEQTIIIALEMAITHDSCYGTKKSQVSSHYLSILKS